MLRKIVFFLIITGIAGAYGYYRFVKWIHSGSELGKSVAIGGISLRTEKYDEGFKLLATNNSVAPITVRVMFTELENMKASEDLPYTFVIPPRRKDVYVLDLKVVDKSSRHKSEFNYNYVYGDCFNVKHDSTCAYLLPYAHGTKQTCSQGYGGSFSHNEPASEHALDFSMFLDTDIHATRDGLVVDVKEDSSSGSKDKKSANDGNHIFVYHKDGTVSVYSHLKQDGALVNVGDRVKAGQKIAISGNTGYSTGPHLHYCVWKATERGTYVTVPTEFRDGHGMRITVKKGESHYAKHPGGPEFDDSLGTDITNEYYQYYHEDLEENGKVELRVVKNDLTIIIFVRNGMKRAQEVNFTFDELENFEASKKWPMTMVVPRRTEKYLMFIRWQDVMKACEYKMSYKYREAQVE